MKRIQFRFLLFILFQFIFISIFSQSTQTPRLVLPIGHTEPILSAVFSRDGKYALTRSLDKTAKLYEVFSGKEIYSFEGHLKVLSSAVFSPDGKRVLTASLDGTAIIYQVSTGKKEFDISAHSDKIYSAIFSPDGKFILTSSSDLTARIFDATDGRQIRIFSNHSSSVNSAVFSLDGKLVLTACNDGSMRVFDVNTGTELILLKTNKGELSNAMFSPDDRNILVYGSDSIVSVFNANTGIEIQQLIGHSGIILSANYSSNGEMIATSSVDASAKIFSSEDGRELRTLEPYRRGYINSVSFSPDSRFVLTAGGFEDFSTRLFEVSTGKEIRTWSHSKGEIYSSEFRSDGKMIITSGSDKTAHINSISSDEVIHVLSGNSVGINNMAISPDGKFVLSVIDDSELRLFEIESGKEVKLGFENFDPIDAGFSRDGKYVLLVYEGIIRVFELSTGNEMPSIYTYTDNIDPGSFDGNGFLVVRAAANHTAGIYNIQSGEEVGYVEHGFAFYMNSCVFSSSGDRIITTGAFDSIPKVFDASSGELLFEITGHSQTVNYATFSSNGQSILTCSDDGLVRLFDSEKANLIRVFEGHRSKVYCAIFSSNGNLILSRSRDEVRLWDAKTGQLLKVFKGHKRNIIDAQFVLNGEFILTTAADHKTILWDVESGKILYTRLQLENNDWLVYDEDYRFDGSPGAIEKLYFTCGLEIIELGQMKDALYVPGLAEKIVNREDINYPKLSEIDICGALPIIEKTEENQGGWKFQLEQRRWPIVRVDVKVDGKTVKSIPSNQLKFENGIVEISLSLSEMQHFFVGGKENVISISAVTAQNGSEIKSRGIDVLFFAEEPKDPPRMFMLMIGVSDYKDDALDLVFPAHDARSLGNALELSANKLLGEANVEMYHVQSKTKENTVYTTPEREGVMKALADIGSKAKANDVLFIFFAGHGVMQGQSDKSFTFLTADASQMNQIGISTTDLISWLSPEGPFKMLPNKTILVYDACNSGQAAKELIAALARNDDDTERLRQIEELGDKSGLFILSASAPNKPAYELPQLGQGLLTYSLLYTLKNNPNIIDQGQDGKGYLNLQKWFLESEREQNQRVLSLGLKQEAQPYGTGNIKLGVVDDEVRNAIQLMDEKPLVFCGNARDENDEDPLELKRSVNDYFENALVRGLTSSLAFVAAETPNANVIKLIYNIEENQVICRVLFFMNKIKMKEITINASSENILSKLVETISSTLEN